MNKSFFRLLFLLCLLVISTFLIAQTNTDSQSATKKFEKESELYYYNFPILKIAQHKMGYYIVYRRQGTLETGKCSIPYSWFTPQDKRGVLSSVNKNMQPYMTVVHKNGEFHYVKLATSTDLKHPSWGIISDNSIADESFNIESLDIQF